MIPEVLKNLINAKVKIEDKEYICSRCWVIIQRDIKIDLES